MKYDSQCDGAVTPGGIAIMPPADITGVGRFSVLADGQGAMFALARFLPRG